MVIDVLYNGLTESPQDVKIYCKTLSGGYYYAPWFALSPIWNNENFWFIESYGSEECRRSTMLEF